MSKATLAKGVVNVGVVWRGAHGKYFLAVF